MAIVLGKVEPVSSRNAISSSLVLVCRNAPVSSEREREREREREGETGRLSGRGFVSYEIVFRSNWWHAPIGISREHTTKNLFDFLARALSLVSLITGQPVNFRPLWPNIVKKCFQDLLQFLSPLPISFFVDTYSLVHSLPREYFHLLPSNDLSSFVIFRSLLFFDFAMSITFSKGARKIEALPS